MEKVANLVEKVFDCTVWYRMSLEVDGQVPFIGKDFFCFYIDVVVRIVVERLVGKPRLVCKHKILQIFAKRLARGVLQDFDAYEIVMQDRKSVV